MPAGTFQFDATPPVLGRRGDLVIAALYDEEQTPPWVGLENVVPLSVTWSEGPQPPTARFRYVFSPALIGDQYPAHVEEVFPLAATGDYVLESDDRIGVFRYTEAGEVEILFDGFALSPQADLGPDGEMATIAAVGVPHREFDTPLGGALMRQASTPTKPGADVATGLPARFNPEGEGNCSPDDEDHPGEDNYDSTIDDPREGHDGEEIKFPVFLGPAPPRGKIGDSDLRVWAVHQAVAHILAVADEEMEWVEWDPENVAGIKAMVPKDPGDPVDVDDPSTYVLGDIEVDDIDVTGMTWPDAVSRMIQPHGWNFRWELDIDEDLVPTWNVLFYRIDRTSGKALLHQAYGSGPLDPARSNASAVSLSRDSHAVVSKVVVDMRPTLVEASYVLAPAFDVDAGDASSLSNFDLGDANCTGANLDKYRVFVLDEAGEGHWLVKSQARIDAGDPAAADLDDVLSTESVYGEEPPAAGVAVKRRRKPISPLITADEHTLEPSRAKLHVSFDYGRTAPGAWDPAIDLPGAWDGKTGTWDEVRSSEWDLLDDRIGIRFTCKDANEVHIGKRDHWSAYAGAFAKVAWPSQMNGILPLVEMMTADDNSNGFNQPIFMLTCVVEADTGPKAQADGKKSSPLKHEVVRRYDGRHRFHKHVVSRYSYLASSDDRGENDEVVEDDTDDAVAMAQAMLRAHQFPRFAGQVTIPRLTTAYRVGDNILGLAGRDIDFDQAAGTEAGGSSVYPSVSSVSWEFESGQRTTLQLTDRRVEHAPQRQKQDKPRFARA